eukprot:tig00020537_g10260.t1
MAKGDRVLVTGAAGYVAAHVVDELLRRGYRVRGTVRRASDKKVQFLRAMHERHRAEPVELVEADLLKPYSFDAAAEDVKFVVHCASPFVTTVGEKDADRLLLQPAVDGTRNVLSAASKSRSVKRVVVTSSFAAVCGGPGERGEGHRYSEEDWNLTSTKANNPYSLSKKLAEEEAWRFHRELPPDRRFELCTINPTLVLGPLLSDRADGTSVSLVRSVLSGRLPLLPPIGFGVVDVRDVAKAHVNALERAEAAGGRHIVSGRSVMAVEVARSLKQIFPGHGVWAWELPGWLMQLASPFVPGLTWEGAKTVVHKKPEINAERSKRVLGIEYTPLEVTLLEMGRSLIGFGLVPRRTGSPDP